MIAKILMIGESGIGKTHTCIEICKVTNSILIDVDDGAEEIIQKLNANVQRLSGATYTNFAKSLKQALKSNADMVIIDSLTELKEIIKRHIKDKIIQKGEFYVGGIERDEPKKIADKDLFVLTWELHPPVYDTIRDIMRAINASGKSYIFTYHPPFSEKLSQGEAKLLSELKRLSNIVVNLTTDSVLIKKDRFANLKELDRSEFIEYVRTIITSDDISKILEFAENL